MDKNTDNENTGAAQSLPTQNGSAFEVWWNGRLSECPDGRFVKRIAQEAWDAAHGRQLFEIKKHTDEG